MLHWPPSLLVFTTMPYCYLCSLQVEAGAPLLVLEAMKMEHPVTAPRAGIIQRLTVSVGGQVSDGQLLMRVEDGSLEGGATGVVV